MMAMGEDRDEARPVSGRAAWAVINVIWMTG
jgi:hypothetical protein